MSITAKNWRSYWCRRPDGLERFASARV